jgi:hypothetical protein
MERAGEGKRGRGERKRKEERRERSQRPFYPPKILLAESARSSARAREALIPQYPVGPSDTI